MLILGINGSPRKKGTTGQLVKEVLNATNAKTEYISLAGKTIEPCKFCLACAKDNVCKVNDDMKKIRSKLVEADGFVFGGCNMWSTLNGLTHNFLERFFQFHHLGKSQMAGKPAVVVGVGGGNGKPPATMIKQLLINFGINPVGVVTAQGAFACYSCDIGNTCNVSTVKDFIDGTGQIDMSFKPSLDKQPKVLNDAAKIGKELKRWAEMALFNHKPQLS